MMRHEPTGKALAMLSTSGSQGPLPGDLVGDAGKLLLILTKISAACAPSLPQVDVPALTANLSLLQRAALDDSTVHEHIVNVLVEDVLLSDRLASDPSCMRPMTMALEVVLALMSVPSFGDVLHKYHDKLTGILSAYASYGGLEVQVELATIAALTSTSLSAASSEAPASIRDAASFRVVPIPSPLFNTESPSGARELVGTAVCALTALAQRLPVRGPAIKNTVMALLTCFEMSDGANQQLVVESLSALLKSPDAFTALVHLLFAATGSDQLILNLSSTVSAVAAKAAASISGNLVVDVLTLVRRVMKWSVQEGAEAACSASTTLRALDLLNTAFVSVLATVADKKQIELKLGEFNLVLLEYITSKYICKPVFSLLMTAYERAAADPDNTSVDLAIVASCMTFMRNLAGAFEGRVVLCEVDLEMQARSATVGEERPSFFTNVLPWASALRSTNGAAASRSASAMYSADVERVPHLLAPEVDHGNLGGGASGSISAYHAASITYLFVHDARFGSWNLSSAGLTQCAVGSIIGFNEAGVEGSGRGGRDLIGDAASSIEHKTSAAFVGLLQCLCLENVKKNTKMKKAWKEQLARLIPEEAAKEASLLSRIGLVSPKGSAGACAGDDGWIPPLPDAPKNSSPGAKVGAQGGGQGRGGGQPRNAIHEMASIASV